MYSSNGSYPPSLTGILNLRVDRLRGNRETCKLEAFDFILMRLCCSNDCCQDLSLKPVKAKTILRSKYEKCSTTRQENDVIVHVLWCEVLGRSSHLWFTYIDEITAIFMERYCMNQRFEGCVIDLYCRTDPTKNLLILHNEN